MKRLIWDCEWQKIKFTKLNTPLKFFERPSSDFYSRFYSKLFQKYEFYDDLPHEWRIFKTQTAIEISKLIREDMNILSVGCGLGFVEKTIVSINPKISIDSYDFSDTANLWLKKVNGINVLNSLNLKKKYDFIFCTQLFYALSDNEIFEFSNFVKSKLKVNGKFLTVDSSLLDAENGEVRTIKHLFYRFKNFIRPLYLFIFKRKMTQFWGWQRDNEHIVRILKKSDLVLNKKFSSVSQSFLVFKLK